jgi:hypothetical protein
MRMLMALAVLPVLVAAATDYASARRKLNLIERDQARPGSSVVLTPAEVNAYARRELAEAVPAGIRDPRIQLGQNAATATAWVDFAKLRASAGDPPGWLMSQLLEGEHPVRIAARIRSGGGRATVDIDSVEISGMNIQGKLLDFLIQNYLLPRVPEAKIGQPFELGHRIDRISVQPAQVAVAIGR